jgi:hypothetical protein
VKVPLEAAYAAAWQGVPKVSMQTLEAGLKRRM